MRMLADIRDPFVVLLALAAAVTLLAFQEGPLVAGLAALSVLVVRVAARPLVDRVIQRPPSPNSTPGRLWYYPLTRRESEVALLLSEGLTHREIGERLHSDRTVDGHLTERSVDANVQNIMNKLNMNRAPQISAWVAERRPRDPVGKV